MSLVAGLMWITAPSTIEGVSGSGGKAGPRWKNMSIDGLSRLLYALMIPGNHPLRRLYDAFDWGSIDRLCASEYKNQGKGGTGLSAAGAISDNSVDVLQRDAL